MVIGLSHFLVLSAIVFACGLLTILLKRNAIGILMGIELVLNSANINLVALNRYWHAGPGAVAGKPLLDGQVFALFVIVIAAAEAAVALAIFLNFYNNFASVDVEKAKMLKG
ncbi:NADH-quinone oxidoreductase subunit NuoK [Humisphaera borealis]|uniref:NADH-quinone oxidoreductase subunit K n=1 Tax=Humisphaera borealis TaxID=2807512 RepID=A0A7M2WW14_9BACT|nr:NADH-quinone oxidoreductase subunit NuoK [Humisphaera borealis]QOV89656.1 NADH-quinone oxidoreductase subunit NuoK [Humisphaera borealis]